MKKIFAALFAMIFCLGLFTATPSAATAAQPVETKKACVNKFFEVGKTFTYDSSGGQPRTAKKALYKDVRLYARGVYSDCGSYARLNAIQYIADPVNFTGCSGGIIQNFKFNGNVIGSWNVPERTIQCVAGEGVYILSLDNPYSENISASAPSNQRCFGTYVQLSLSGTGDKSGDSPSFCII